MSHVGDVGEGRGGEIKTPRESVGDREKGDALRRCAGSGSDTITK